MWIFYAFGSALFAGLTSILAKCGIRHTDSDVATAIRTIVVLVFSWIMVFVVGAQDGIAAVSGKTWLFLILSGVATGASWLCYFHALQAGDVNKVVPIDKSSTILTIVLAFLFLGEEVSALKIVCVILIGAGTFLMIQKKETEKSAEQEKKSWLLYACLFCKSYFDSRQDRHRGTQFQSRNGNPDSGGALDGMDHGICEGQAEGDWQD